MKYGGDEHIGSGSAWTDSYFMIFLSWFVNKWTKELQQWEKMCFAKCILNEII